MTKLKINGQVREVDATPEMPLLWAIRDLLQLTGTKYGCGLAQCGACTIYLDGTPVRSCQTTVEEGKDADITTIEGLSGKITDTVRAVWTEMDVPQCGYCQSGQIMAAVALLTENRTPTDSDVDDAMAGNLCRCGTYHRIRAGIHEAAKRLGG